MASQPQPQHQNGPKMLNREVFRRKRVQKKKKSERPEESIWFSILQSFEIPLLKSPPHQWGAKEAPRKVHSKFSPRVLLILHLLSEIHMSICVHFCNCTFSFTKMRNHLFYAICYYSDSKTLWCLVAGLLFLALGGFFPPLFLWEESFSQRI